MYTYQQVLAWSYLSVRCHAALTYMSTAAAFLLPVALLRVQAAGLRGGSCSWCGCGFRVLAISRSGCSQYVFSSQQCTSKLTKDNTQLVAIAEQPQVSSQCS
eukprot:GHRQ01025280.1.p2 GENE.GHRQ01025280.1~~GHRQ01025280.1.p2  ORF type:complete len:102 (-),score=14.55 GHRQ01025280.1:38-343(-)